MSGGWSLNTRQKIIRPTTLTYPTGGGIVTYELPKTGLLARLYLHTSITVGGTVNTPNPLGIASAIKKVRVYTNGGQDIYSVSGVGYGYMLNFNQELMGVNGRQIANQYNTAVSATSFNLDMVIPIAINMNSPIGMILLQNEQLQVLLSIEYETPANIGGSTATVTAGTTAVAMEFFAPPADPKDWPDLSLIHQTVEDQISIAATGDYIVNFQRGNVYLEALFGFGVAASAADNWSRLILRINQSDILYDLEPNLVTQIVSFRQNISRGLGYIPIDLIGSDGLGTYASARDYINTALLTDFQAVLTATSTGTLYLVRRMLQPLARRK